MYSYDYISIALYNTEGSLKCITLFKLQNYTVRTDRKIPRLFKYPHIYSVLHTK